MSSLSFIKQLPTEQAMLNFAAQVAAVCPETAIIFLYGNLGAGKTTFSRGFLRGLGYKGPVKSPTYTIVEPYEWENRTVYHFDFYRLQQADELEYIGIQDYFVPHAICLIEWPEYGEAVLPSADLSCYIESVGEGRKVKLMADSECGLTILKRLPL